MHPGDDFDFALDEWIKQHKQPKPTKYVPKPIPKIELTIEQKRIIVDYILGSVGKGVFEDVTEFWEGISDIDAAYPSYRQAAEEFVYGLKEKILKELL